MPGRNVRDDYLLGEGGASGAKGGVTGLCMGGDAATDAWRRALAFSCQHLRPA